MNKEIWMKKPEFYCFVPLKCSRIGQITFLKMLLQWFCQRVTIWLEVELTPGVMPGKTLKNCLATPLKFILSSLSPVDGSVTVNLKEQRQFTLTQATWQLLKMAKSSTAWSRYFGRLKFSNNVECRNGSFSTVFLGNMRPLPRVRQDILTLWEASGRLVLYDQSPSGRMPGHQLLCVPSRSVLDSKLSNFSLLLGVWGWHEISRGCIEFNRRNRYGIN